MNQLVVLLLSLFAFGALAMAMRRHQQNVFGRHLTTGMGRCLRFGGWSLLLLAMVVAVRSQGWVLGLVSYSGHTSLAAGLVFLALGTLVHRMSSRKPLTPRRRRCE